jgi:ligand-binding sensor domain-containing protein
VHSDGYEWSILDQDNSTIPFDSVTCILRDGNGLLWVSWRSGLASFDGTSWKNIPEMTGKRVTSLVVQGIGIIWAGLDGDQQTGGLARLKDGEWKFYNTVTTGIPSSRIISLAIDHDQCLWIGSADKGITSYNGLEWTEYNPENTGFLPARISCINIDADGNTWAGTSASELIQFTKTGRGILTTGTGKPVTSLVTDKDGMLWVGTAGAGVLKYHAGKWTSYTKENSYLPGDSIIAMAIPPDGKIVASYTDGHLINFK